MKRQLFFICIIILNLAGTCRHNSNKLKIKNSSERVITVDFSEDTLFPKRDNNSIPAFIRDKIKPSETIIKIRTGKENTWPLLIKHSINGKLNVFFIDVDTLKKYNSWNYLRKNKLYTKKEYSIKELIDNHWKIEFR